MIFQDSENYLEREKVIWLKEGHHGMQISGNSKTNFKSPTHATTELRRASQFFFFEISNAEKKWNIDKLKSDTPGQFWKQSACSNV